MKNNKDKIITSNDKIKNPYIFFLMGPTCSGKTEIAMEISKHFPIEIINVDTAMIYKEMDIGTNKPNKNDQRKIKHYLIDIIKPYEFYSMGNFLLDISNCINKIIKKNKIPLLVGGSISYFNMIHKGLTSLPSKNFLIRNRLFKFFKTNNKSLFYDTFLSIGNMVSNKDTYFNKRRIERLMEIYFSTRKFFNKKYICINSDQLEQYSYNIIPISIQPKNRFNLNKDIRCRFLEMLEKGFVKEVDSLVSKYKLHENTLSMQCIGYKQVYQYLKNNKCKNSYLNMIHDSITSTRKLVKKQLTLMKKWNNLIKLDLEKKKKSDILETLNKYIKK